MNKTLEFLTGLQRFGWRLGLQNIAALLQEIGNPHLKLRTVHIAGSNGKGSTAAFLESILRASGYKTGLYTSPHLVDVRERIRIDFMPIAEERLIDCIRQLKPAVLSLGCTYFETLTAAAFLYFAEEEVDIAVVEVGLGGRYDATNVIKPLLSIITAIDLEHTEYLGTDKTQIAAEKAGIIKDGVPCLSANRDDAVDAVLSATASEHGSRYYRLFEQGELQNVILGETFSQFDLRIFGHDLARLRLTLPGAHQISNAATATAAALLLQETNFKIASKSLRFGLKKARWPARLQLLQKRPKILIDVAHNAAALQNLMSTLQSLYRYNKLLLVIGLLQDKNYAEISKIISAVADYVFVVTPIEEERALSSAQLAQEVAKYTKNYKNCVTLTDGWADALAMAGKDDLICITGSHYVVGEWLKQYKKLDKEDLIL